MTKIVLTALFATSILSGCMNGNNSNGNEPSENSIYVHDTISAMSNGEFVYNLPCKVVNIHQEQEGKSLLFIWLHGGVHDRKMHDLFEMNHLDCCAADDSVLNYLRERKTHPNSHKTEINDNMRGFDPTSEDDMDNNGLERYIENNDETGWN